MPTKYNPKYSITPQIASSLMRIEAAKVQLFYLPLTTTVLSSLRETARLYTTHYSTMIEGNRLGPDQIEHVIKHEGHFPGRERDEREVKGYYAALHMVDQTVAAGRGITEKTIQSLYALVMAGGRIKVKPTKYRDGQNAIRDSRTKNLVYMPPEAKRRVNGISSIDVGDVLARMQKMGRSAQKAAQQAPELAAPIQRAQQAMQQAANAIQREDYAAAQQQLQQSAQALKDDAKRVKEQAKEQQKA